MMIWQVKNSSGSIIFWSESYDEVMKYYYYFLEDHKEFYIDFTVVSF